MKGVFRWIQHSILASPRELKDAIDSMRYLLQRTSSHLRDDSRQTVKDDVETLLFTIDNRQRSLGEIPSNKDHGENE